jgi:hypothetical protein
MVHWLEMKEDITCGTLAGCGYRYHKDFEHLLLMKKIPVYGEDTNFRKRKSEKSLEEDYCIKSAATTHTICAHKPFLIISPAKPCAFDLVCWSGVMHFKTHFDTS